MAADRRQQRARSFGAVAELYDRARPSYPAPLVDDLMALRPREVLDVGTGTGKAARLFLERGCRVTGVEPDERMAAVARAHGIAVDIATFEEWDPQRRRFDLLVSGQAWHWVDGAAGMAKAAAVLRPNAHLAVFWNLGAHDPHVLAALEPLYAEFVPELAATTTALGRRDASDSERVQRLLDSDDFTGVELRTYAWDITYSRDAWLRLLSTQSDHSLLEANRRERLFDALARAIDDLGGAIDFHYQTVLILATRSAPR